MTDIIKGLETEIERLQYENNFKTGLISILSHDSKEIFGSVIWLIDAVAQKNISEEDFFKLLPQVKCDAEKNLQTVQDTASWLKTQYGKFEVKVSTVEVSDLFHSLKEKYTVKLQKKNINLLLKADINQSLNADRLFLEYILDKLLNNAIKYSLPGQDVYLQYSVEGNEAVISIIDCGIGMSEKNLNTVLSFGNAVFEGTAGEIGVGLSLKIVDNFVSLMHGNMKIISAENKGTTVSIFLPQI